MVALKTFKRLIYQLDMFCSSELMRYQSETQYKTLTGGLLSLLIIGVVVGGFASMVADTLQRVTINSSLVTQKQSNPPFVSLKPGNENFFMLGLSIQSTDLSFLADLVHGPQYFSVTMKIIQINSGIPDVNVTHLEQCTHEHWEMMPDFNTVFDSFGVGGWLCLPLGSQLPLQGSYTSPINQEILIQVFQCQNVTGSSLCASQQQIDALLAQYQNFYLSLNYINPVINPNQQNFISYYIEGNDYVIFSSHIGSQAWIYFSDYSIATDDSIWPYSHITTTAGCIVEQKAINHPYSVIYNSPFASVFLAKSSNSLKYSRTVQKLSAVLSYIGGLVGAITALLFLIKSYTDTSLEVTIGLSLFERSQKTEQLHTQKQNKKEKGFNFFGFMKLTMYRLMKFVGWKGTSNRQQLLQQCQLQAIKQMDIQLLLRRVIKLETCISRLFTQKQLKQIREGQPITIDSAKKMRLLLLSDQTDVDKTKKDLPQENPLQVNDIIEDGQVFNTQSGTSICKFIPNQKTRFRLTKEYDQFKQSQGKAANIERIIQQEPQMANKQDQNKSRIRPIHPIFLPPIDKKLTQTRFSPIN